MGQAKARGTYEERKANPKGNPVIEPCAIRVLVPVKPNAKYKPVRITRKLKSRKKARYALIIAAPRNRAVVLHSKQRGSRGYRQCIDWLRAVNHPLAHYAQVAPVE